MAGTSVSPTQSAYQSDIFLDKHIYNPGDLVAGQVTLKLSRKLCCDTVALQLYGSARVFFVQKITKPGALNQSRAFEQEQILVDQKQDLWLTMNQNVQKQLSLEEIARRASSTAIRLPSGRKETSPGLEQGDHTFAFSFPLPQTGLHTSFDARNSAGYIRYYILLKVLNGSAVVMRKKLLFPVVCPKVLHSYPLSKTDRTVAQRKDFEKDSYISVQLCMEKRMFVPGEPIKGTITIENRSRKSVKHASLYIHQETICYSTRPEIQIHETSFKPPGMGLNVHKIKSGDRLEYPIEYNVPALLPNIDVPNCIQTYYYVQLDVGFVRNCPKHNPIAIKIPISIGTHLQAPGEQYATAPPAYEDIENRENFGVSHLQQFPPPDYNSSVMGMSAVDGEDQAGYAPLCYHYNFGFCLDDESNANKKRQ